MTLEQIKAEAVSLLEQKLANLKETMSIDTMLSSTLVLSFIDLFKQEKENLAIVNEVYQLLIGSQVAELRRIINKITTYSQLKTKLTKILQ